VFGLASLRDLPGIEKLEDAGLLQRRRMKSRSTMVWGLDGEDRELTTGSHKP
jgi:hypothetical protein